MFQSLCFWICTWTAKVSEPNGSKHSINLSTLNFFPSVVSICFQTFELHRIFEDFITCVGFEVLTEVVMESAMFWDITSCTPLKVN
jgi:hypothetical protein